MGVFDRIEAQEDCEASRLKLEIKTMARSKAILAACQYKGDGRFHAAKCEHPERTPGRVCVRFDCPVIDFIEMN
jgi:hypothetical protein